MIKKIDKFIYPGTHRETIEGKRHYVIGEEKLKEVVNNYLVTTENKLGIDLLTSINEK